MRSFVTILRGAAAAALAVLACSPTPAQETPLSKQERARLRFEALHESMQRLQVALAQSAPDESKVLSVGNKFVQEARIAERMEHAKALLVDGKWDEALEEMGGIRERLHSLMNLLLNRDLDLQELLEEIARLEAFKERVEKIIDEQREEKDDAARTEALQKHLEDLERAKAEIDELIRDQQELRDRANQAGLSAAPGEAAQMEAREGELEEGAKSLAERAEQLEREHKELTEPKEGAPKSESGQPGEGACSGSCQGAAGSMGKAKQKLGQNRPERSLEDMDQALQKLEAAKKALEAMTEEARRELLELPFEQQAKAQEVTRVATDKLAEDMEKAGQGEEGQPKRDTPGTKNVQQAVPKQKAAAGQLKEYKPAKAKQDQQDALEDLEQAKRALEDALAQLRQQLQDEVLRALEERFGAMLAKQKELSARTVVTDRLRGEALTADGGLPAALAARCAELSEGELGLASEAGDALKLLEEEATTAVFPEIVEELKADLERVADRLAAHKTARATQAMQSEIEDTLRMLLDALRRTIEDGDGQAGQCNGQPPLVPRSAELKLILALQKRVHKRTVGYDTQVPEQLRVTEEARTEAVEISRKQGRVKDLTRKLAVKINKDNEAANQ